MKNRHSEEFLTKKEQRLMLYTSFRSQGASYEEIANIVGLSRETVAQFCRENGIGYSEEERKRYSHDACRLEDYQYKPYINWQDKLDKAYGTGNRELIKVDRQSDGESIITNRCAKCGEVQTISSVHLRQKRDHFRKCISCQKIETERRRRNELLDLQEARKQEKRHNRKIVQLAFPMCTKCGQLVPKGHSVCEECKKQTNRELWRKHDIVRRSRLDDVIKGKDITLKKLYERDNGVCYICGKVCDWTDREWKDGVFIVGRNYPTIEHLKPLSKGGNHTWDNIKLACLYCNSKKGNREAV